MRWLLGTEILTWVLDTTPSGYCPAPPPPPAGSLYARAVDDRGGEGLIGPADGVGFAARLDRWLADARVDDSAAGRARERWLHAAAEADATFGGVLLDLAERGTPVSVQLRSGRRHQGVVEVIGGDFVALRLAAGGEVLAALAAIATVRTAPRADPALGERVVTTGLRLADVLAELAAERARVLVVPLGDADLVAGDLRAVGRDVVTVRSDGDPPVTTYLRLAAVAEVVL